MAKWKKKSSEIDAEFFDKSKPEVQWPVGVRVNVESPTGYSVGTLDTLLYDMGDNKEYPYIDGFVVKDLHYIITHHDGTQEMQTKEEFEKFNMLV